MKEKYLKSEIMKQCTTCGEKSASILHQVKNYPCYEGIINLESPWAEKINDLNMGICPNCGNIYNLSRPEKIFLEDYYFRYYSSPTVENTSMGNFRHELYNLVLDYTGKSPKSLYQDSCQDGTLLRNFSNLGWSVMGNELDAIGNIAQESGLSINKANFFQSTIKQKYDVFVSAHVLEHVDNCILYLRRIRENLKEQGKVIIQVPGFEERSNQYGAFQFLNCHASYFTNQILKFLFESNGFKVDNILKTDNATLCVLARYNELQNKIPKPDIQESFQKFQDYLDLESQFLKSIKGFISSHVEKNARLLFYGAGGALTELLYHLPELTKYPHQIVDITRSKHGHRLLLSPIRVESPEKMKSYDPDYMIITAPAFQDEIVSYCRKIYPANWKVILLFPAPRIINL